MEGKEGKDVISIAVGLSLTMLAISTILMIYTLVSSSGNKVLENAKRVEESTPLARITDMSTNPEPVLCTLLVSALQEFGATDLMYVHIIDTAPTHYIYTYENFDIATAPAEATITRSKYPVEDAVIRLLKYSDKRCKVTLIKDDATGMYGTQVIIQ